MQYTTITHVQTPEGDDVHLRFGFDMEKAKLVFSIIVALSGKPEPREFKANTVEEIIAWLRFNRLTTALFNSPSFCRKYQVVKTNINENMLVLTINKLPTFYVRSSTGSWDCSNDIAIFAQLGEAKFEEAKKILGTSFMARYEKREKELAEISRNHQALKSEMNIAQQGSNAQTEKSDFEMPLKVVDINNSTSAVF